MEPEPEPEPATPQPAPAAAPRPPSRPAQRARPAAVSPWPRAIAWLAVAGTALVLLLCAGGGLLWTRSLEKRARRAEARLDERRRDDGVLRDCRFLLGAIADRLRSAGPPLPESLPEAPPKDPWGTPVRYRRHSPERAELGSAGPDRAHGTIDDVREEIRGE